MASLMSWAECADITFASQVVTQTVLTIAPPATTAATSSPPPVDDQGTASSSESEKSTVSNEFGTVMSDSSDVSQSTAEPLSSSSPPPPDNTSHPSEPASSLNPPAIGLGVGIGVGVISLILLAVYFFRRRRKRREAASDAAVDASGTADMPTSTLEVVPHVKAEPTAAHIAEMPNNSNPTRGRAEAPSDPARFEMATDEGIQGRHELRGDETRP